MAIYYNFYDFASIRIHCPQNISNFFITTMKVIFKKDLVLPNSTSVVHISGSWITMSVLKTSTAKLNIYMLIYYV